MKYGLIRIPATSRSEADACRNLPGNRAVNLSKEMTHSPGYCNKEHFLSVCRYRQNESVAVLQFSCRTPGGSDGRLVLIHVLAHQVQAEFRMSTRHRAWRKLRSGFKTSLTVSTITPPDASRCGAPTHSHLTENFSCQTGVPES